MRFRYWILAMMTSLLASCSSDAVLSAEGGEEETSDLVTEVSASCGGFTADTSRSTEQSGTSLTVKDTDPENDAYILGMKEFKEGDKIYILQKGPNLTPEFPGDFFDHRKDEDYKMPDNIYLYEYRRNDNANWSSEYNFKYNPNRSNPISWGEVKKNGSIGNSFIFYAFCDNLKELEPRGPEDLHPDWVGTGDNLYYHHAYGGKWKKSDNVQGGYDYSNDWHAHHYQNHCGVPDFMGAYHTTSTLYSRLRFKFYHLLAYVRVTLYVPVVDTYKEKDPKTDKETERETGYDETAFVLSNEGENPNYGAGVWIGNNTSGQRTVRTRFTIDWNANRSSDKDAPLTQVLTNATTPGFQFAYCMYRHNPLDVTDIRYKPTKAEEDFTAIKEGIGEETLDVTEFVASSVNARKYLTKSEDNKYYDKVRRYEFSAAMPAQKISSSILMQIHVRVPGTGVDGIKNGGTTSSTGPYNSYAKYTLSASNLLAGKNDLAFKQNTITHLRIYLPRAADEAILVNAAVLPWENTHTDMAVSPDDWGD